MRPSICASLWGTKELDSAKHGPSQKKPQKIQFAIHIQTFNEIYFLGPTAPFCRIYNSAHTSQSMPMLVSDTHALRSEIMWLQRSTCTTAILHGDPIASESHIHCRTPAVRFDGFKEARAAPLLLTETLSLQMPAERRVKVSYTSCRTNEVSQSQFGQDLLVGRKKMWPMWKYGRFSEALLDNVRVNSHVTWP